jgi:hypothetical protein
MLKTHVSPEYHAENSAGRPVESLVLRVNGYEGRNRS